MRKSTLFISAVLTTFMLAVLAGVVSMNKKSSDVTAVVTEPAPTEVAAELPQPTATVAAFITPEQAAALAAQVLGHDDVYSVETSVFNGESVYLVTFSAGDLVYVSPQGMIVSVTPAPVVVYSAPVANTQNKVRRPPTGGGGENEGGEHEGGEHEGGEHEGGED